MPTKETSTDSEISFNLCKVVLDEDRLMILGLLALQPRSTEDLIRLLPARGSAATKLARHIQQLRSAGLVTVQATGDGESYQLDVDQLLALKRQLFSPPAGPELSDDEKVLAAFVKGERLIQLPVQLAKMKVVLSWLAQRFEPGMEYPERTVNEMLSGHEVDYATLRRLLCDYGLLTRTAGLYRRTEGS
jgi:hypothetical protein